MNSLHHVHSVFFLSILSTSIFSGGQLLAGATQSGQSGQNGKQNGNGSQASSSSSSSGGSGSSSRGIPQVASFDDPAPALPVAGIGMGLVAQRELLHWEVVDGVARIAGAAPTVAEFRRLLFERFPDGVQYLNLAGRGLGNEAIVMLADAIRIGDFGDLRGIDLSLNVFDTEHAIYLANALRDKPNRNLETLDIHNETVEEIRAWRVRMEEELQRAYEDTLSSGSSGGIGTQDWVARQTEGQSVEAAIKFIEDFLKSYSNVQTPVRQAYEDLWGRLQLSRRHGPAIDIQDRYSIFRNPSIDRPKRAPNFAALRLVLTNLEQFVQDESPFARFKAILAELEERYQKAESLSDAYTEVFNKHNMSKLRIELPYTCGAFWRI